MLIKKRERQFCQHFNLFWAKKIKNDKLQLVIEINQELQLKLGNCSELQLWDIDFSHRR